MSLKESISDVKNPIYLISMINEHLFENLGFGGMMRITIIKK